LVRMIIAYANAKITGTAEGAFSVCPGIEHAAVGQFFEHGSETVSCGMKVSCRFFRITMLQKPSDHHCYGDEAKRGMLPLFLPCNEGVQRQRTGDTVKSGH